MVSSFAIVQTSAVFKTQLTFLLKWYALKTHTILFTTIRRMCQLNDWNHIASFLFFSNRIELIRQTNSFDFWTIDLIEKCRHFFLEKSHFVENVVILTEKSLKSAFLCTRIVDFNSSANLGQRSELKSTSDKLFD